MVVRQSLEFGLGRVRVAMPPLSLWAIVSTSVFALKGRSILAQGNALVVPHMFLILGKLGKHVRMLSFIQER